MENFSELNSENGSIRELYMDILNKRQKFLVRMANDSDKEAFKYLWTVCFNDTIPFVEWFFENRFFPEYSVCIEFDGRIICAMQSIKAPIWIREESITGVIVAGVCTHPDFRGMHLMKSMFAFYIEQMRNKGITAITYKPENMNTYHSLGHFPSTNTIWYEFVSGDFDAKTRDSYDDSFSLGLENYSFTICRIKDMTPFDVTKCFDLYSKIAYLYSGMVDRDFELFKLKASDYNCVGGNIAIYYLDNTVLAYCFYFDMENVIYGEEFIAVDFTSASILINHLKEIFKNKDLKIKLQSDFTEFFKQKPNTDDKQNDISLNHIFDAKISTFDENKNSLTPKYSNVKMVEQNVLGVTNVDTFVKHLNLSRKTDKSILEGIIIETFDNVIKENNIKFNLLGEKSSYSPCVKINTGSFVQILCGYKSIYEVIAQDCEKEENEKEVTFLKNDNLTQIDKILPRFPCFIVDEY